MGLNGCEHSMIRINPKPIGIPGIITKLMIAVNQFIGKENTGEFFQAIANQNIYYVLRGIGELLEVFTLRCPKK